MTKVIDERVQKMIDDLIAKAKVASEEYKKLLSTLNKRSRKGNEFANKRRRKR